MAKYGNSFYLQLTRKLFEEPYCNMSNSAFRLYCTLKELEQRYCGGYNNRDFFIRSNEELCKDSHLSINTLKSAKAELKQLGLIQVGKAHWIDRVTNKKSEKHISSYKLLE